MTLPSPTVPAAVSRSTQLHKLLANPLRLRAAVSLALLTVWYFAIFSPMTGQIEETKVQLTVERERVGIAKDVDLLRNEAKQIKDRVPPRSDQNEWLQFLMAQVRALPVKLVTLNPTATRDVGPYKIVAFRIVVEGAYADVWDLLRSLESSPRMVRVETIRISTKSAEPTKQAAKQKTLTPLIEMQLTVIGILY